MKISMDRKYFKICAYVVISIWIAVLGILAIYYIRDIGDVISGVVGKILILLNPLIIGIVIAYLLDPLAEFYEKRLGGLRKFRKEKDKPPVASGRVIPTTAAFLTLILFGWLCAIIISEDMQNFEGLKNINVVSDWITQRMQEFSNLLKDVKGSLDKIGLFKVDMSTVQQFTSRVDQWTRLVGQKTIEIVAGLGAKSMDIMMGIVISFYLLKDKKQGINIWNKGLDALFPKTVTDELRDLWSDIDAVISGYIRGQLTDALIMTVMISVTLSVIGIKSAILIGIVAGVFNVIPYFGPVVGFVLAGFVGILSGEPMKGVFSMVAIFMLQQIDGWVIVPKIVGESVKLHPVVVLMAILIGGSLFGLWGMLFGVPIAALIRVFVIRYFHKSFQSKQQRK